MNKLSKEQLKALAMARRLPMSRKLGDLSASAMETLTEFIEQGSTENILGRAIKNREARNIPLENQESLSEHYRQHELQVLKDGGEPVCRRDYTDWVNSALGEEIEQKVGMVYRTRTATLDPGSEVPFHIDDPEQRRVVAILKGSHEFTIDVKGDISTIPMEVGELWFINSAWPHRVRNTSENHRVALLLNIVDHKAFEEKLKSEQTASA